MQADVERLCALLDRFDMTLTEPTTMLTDYALTAFCLWCVCSLPSAGRGRLWQTAFLVTGLAALLGGTAHGFRVPLGAHWSTVWNLTIAAIALSAALLVGAGVRAALRTDRTLDTARHERIPWLKRAVVITLVALIVLVSGITLHQHLNYNDLYHLIQMGGLYCLYRAARLDLGRASSYHLAPAQGESPAGRV